jgi:hypothetical protein
MNDEEVRAVFREVREREAANVAKLTAALEVLDTIAATKRAGVGRDIGKAITGATRAADGIRAVLVNRYQVEV